jgi:hypothetical protein
MHGEPGPLRVELTLELDHDADPPSGRLLSHGASYPFGGWLRLARALERAIDAHRDQPQGPRTPGVR